ncbi:gp242 [Sphingomonas phage PAU]|uniref:gp242 n=1 Tax=Sphingomonas phage PAU TaxID=1150991 RepID=UPI00025733F8|nr:gp242 [Sphingomonas phage PAU]AFF28240.1 gp242 [Sphingomonas phage PAU]
MISKKRYQSKYDEIRLDLNFFLVTELDQSKDLQDSDVLNKVLDHMEIADLKDYLESEYNCKVGIDAMTYHDLIDLLTLRYFVNIDSE